LRFLTVGCPARGSKIGKTAVDANMLREWSGIFLNSET
jgi:hypothetical protein